MSVEVKQLVIKSTVIHNDADQQRTEDAGIDLELLKEMVMEECKELIIESLNSLQER